MLPLLLLLTIAQTPAQDSARAAANARALAAMRVTAPPPVPLDAYAGRYEHPRVGPVVVRRGGAGLTMQIGEGQAAPAELEYHGANTFRASNGPHVTFTVSGDSVVALTTFRDRDQFTARKAVVVSAPPVPRIDLTGAEAVVGRWNLRILNYLGPNDVTSSWLEIERSGYEALVGRFVGLIGAARPIGNIDWDPKQRVARFRIPMEWELLGPEWDVTTRDLRFEVMPSGDGLVGRFVYPHGPMRVFVGKRAPLLLRANPAAWTAPVALFNGRDFTGWTPAPTARSLPNFWVVKDGALATTAGEGVNLMTVQRYQDFRLHAEYRLPNGRSAGIFPRGRYWVILNAKPDTMPFKGTTGAVHGFLVPSQDAGRADSGWQSIDITLVGRRITTLVNGTTVIADQIIPGITGSALDGDEAAPGPIMLQGEEFGVVEFRNITISVPVVQGSARSAIERQYQRLDSVILRNDVPGMLAIQAPSFSSVNPGGVVYDYAAMEERTRLLASLIDSTIHVRNTIREFASRPDTAVVMVCQEYSRMQRLGDGRPHRIDTSALQRERWVLVGNEWRRERVDQVHGLRWFVDGVRVDPARRVDPSRPYTPPAPYKPDPDPPTNCGRY
jgi:hypothetical protein